MGTKNHVDISLLAKASNLVALVDYQSSSVVSRTVIDRRAGTVTLFAFDQGQGLSEHTAPFDAMAYIIDREVVITIDGHGVKVKNGEMTIMPANRPHALKADTKFKMMLVMIRG